MFTVRSRPSHSGWQSTKPFLYVIGKPNSMLIWTYIGVLDISGKHNFKLLLYTRYKRNTCQQRSKLLHTKHDKRA